MLPGKGEGWAGGIGGGEFLKAASGRDLFKRTGGRRERALVREPHRRMMVGGGL